MEFLLLSLFWVFLLLIAIYVKGSPTAYMLDVVTGSMSWTAEDDGDGAIDGEAVNCDPWLGNEVGESDDNIAGEGDVEICPYPLFPYAVPI